MLLYRSLLEPDHFDHAPRTIFNDWLMELRPLILLQVGIYSRCISERLLLMRFNRFSRPKVIEPKLLD